MSPGLKAPLRRRGVVGRGRGEGRGGVGRWGEGGRVGGNGKCWFSRGNHPQIILKPSSNHSIFIKKSSPKHTRIITITSSYFRQIIILGIPRPSCFTNKSSKNHPLSSPPSLTAQWALGPVARVQSHHAFTMGPAWGEKCADCSATLECTRARPFRDILAKACVHR